MPPRSRLKSLRNWSEIADRGWEVLLLGNGMSINVSPKFDYKSLFGEARFKGGLSRRDREIFEVFDTTNFETVLSKLRDAISLAEALQLDPEPYKKRFQSVQAALGRTVRRVHLEPGEVPAETLAALQDCFLEHEAIFTTSYDLLAYWTFGYGNGYRRFCDCFWANDRNEFDPTRPGDLTRTPVYYLHGALHLVVGGSGVTRKLTKRDLKDGEQTLLDRFDKPIEGDPEARPLLVTEGSSRAKLHEIEANAYLDYVYKKLMRKSGPLVVFGNSLGGQDQHLIEAINANPKRPVAISIRDKGPRAVREERHRILGVLRAKERDVEFFDPATHPLGLPEHRLEPAKKIRRTQVAKATPRRPVKKLAKKRRLRRG